VKRVALALLAAAAVAAWPPSAGATDAGAAVLRTCDHKVDFNLKITSARNMRCSAARRVMRRHQGSIARHFDAPNGFRCNLVEGRPISGIWRCTKDRKAFRFAFGD
jgi:hypothetical protein